MLAAPLELILAASPAEISLRSKMWASAPRLFTHHHDALFVGIVIRAEGHCSWKTNYSRPYNTPTHHKIYKRHAPEIQWCVCGFQTQKIACSSDHTDGKGCRCCLLISAKFISDASNRPPGEPWFDLWANSDPRGRQLNFMVCGRVMFIVCVHLISKLSMSMASQKCKGSFWHCYIADESGCTNP